MEDVGAMDSARPTVGQMLTRDVFIYVCVANPVVVAVILLILPAMLEFEEGDVELVDPALAFGMILLCVGVSLGLIYWRHSLVSSILASGVEVPGEVTSVTRSGDAVRVEYTYRWQAETVTSAGKIGGFVRRRRVKEEVGTKATLLVDPAKPERFLVLDSFR